MDAPSRRSSRGFTLIEVIVALGLMAVGMLAIAPLFVNSMKGNAVGQDFGMLNGLAKEQLEQVMQYNFIDSRLAVPVGAKVYLNDASGTAVQVAGQLYRNQHPTTQTVGGVTASVPYELVYVVQDFNLDANSRPDFTTAVDDSNAAWVANTGVKLVTVFVASSRKSIQGSAYDLGSSTATASNLLLSSKSVGKQIRMCAVKSP